MRPGHIPVSNLNDVAAFGAKTVQAMVADREGPLFWQVRAQHALQGPDAGDRLDLPKDTAHEAEVGSQGVICLEAHQR